MTRILVALDGSDESIAAADQARRLFGNEAEYLAINVFEAPRVTTPSLRDTLTWGAVWRYEALGSTEEDADAAREVAADEALSEAQRAGLDPAQGLGQVGDPAPAIVDAADRHHVDAIVVGWHQRGWLSRLIDPPVGPEVAKRAHVPVLLAKGADS